MDGRDAAMLIEACRTLDQLDELDALQRKLGTLTADGRVAPHVVEARLQRIALARILAALRLPEDLSAPVVRPQRRTGGRGIYSLKRRDEAI